MIVELIKAAGIAQQSYFIGSEDAAAVVDPQRDCQVYLDIARRHEMRIRYIFETHRNEDFVTGSTELQGLTGAEIHHGPGLDWKYGDTLRDGQEFRIGNLVLAAIRTPGHTDESMSYTVADTGSDGAMVVVFTGDTILVNSVGRTDLYGPEAVSRLAATLYDSINDRLLPLGDEVIMCPAHGSGSVCGLNIGDRDLSTLGIERRYNPFLQTGSRELFIRQKAGEALETPPYFRRMERLNLEGPPRLGNLPRPDLLSPDAFRLEMEKGAVLVDASEPAAFGGAHIKAAYSIWLEGLPVFAGWVLPYDRPVLLALQEPGHLDRAVRYLVRLGFERITGYLRDGTRGWYNAGLPVEQVALLTVHQLKSKIDAGEALTVLDVRARHEWDAGHIKGATNIYVGHLEQRVDEVPRDKPVVVLCGSGRRSSLAASILLRAGFTHVSNVLGSMTAWRAAHYPVASEGEPAGISK